MKNSFLNPFNKQVTSGISLITAVKNRMTILTEALATWVKNDEIDEIIIVDWSSDESLIPVVKTFQNGKIFLAVVTGQDKWILTHAYNLAARLASRNKILKIDADVMILPGFFDQQSLKPGLFYTGNWMLGRDENEKHLNGTVFLYRDDFFKVNGYNEYIKFYGWDDSDLYARLESGNLKRLDIDIRTLHHIQHQNRTTLQSTAGYFKNMSDFEKSNLNILTNRYLCTKLLKWSLQNKMMGFTLQAEDNHTWICNQSGRDMNTVSAEQYIESETNAIKERLKQFEFGIHDDLASYLKRDELIEYYNLFLSKESDKTAGDLFHVISKFNYLYSETILKKNIESEKLSEEVTARNADLEKIGQELSEKNSEIEQLTENLHSTEEKIQYREKEIQLKETEINHKEALIKQAEETLDKLNKDLESGNQELRTKEEMLRQSEATIHQLDQLVESKEKLILSKDGELQSKDLEIHENKSEILKQNIEIRSWESENKKLLMVVEQQESDKGELERQIETLKRDLEDKERVIISNQEQLNSIYLSYSWRTGHLIFSLISKIFFWLPGIGKLTDLKKQNNR